MTTLSRVPAETLFSAELVDRAASLIRLCSGRGVMIATAESCTGGLVAALLTEIAGSSAVVDRGFVTYSNEAKAELLDVPWSILETEGAVSIATAKAMAEGAIRRSHAQLAVSITGIAGPGGGTPEKPVGLVHFATARHNGRIIHAERRFGPLSRLAIRLASVEQAMTLLEEALSEF